MTTSTTEFLQEQKRLAEAATPGPWTWAAHTAVDVEAWAVFDARDWAVADNGDGFKADAEFIAAARTTVPKLIAAVEAVEEALALGDELEKTAPEYIDPTARRLQIANRVLNLIESGIEAALGGEGE